MRKRSRFDLNFEDGGNHLAFHQPPVKRRARVGGVGNDSSPESGAAERKFHRDEKGRFARRDEIPQSSGVHDPRPLLRRERLNQERVGDYVQTSFSRDRAPYPPIRDTRKRKDFGIPDQRNEPEFFQSFSPFSSGSPPPVRSPSPSREKWERGKRAGKEERILSPLPPPPPFPVSSGHYFDEGVYHDYEEPPPPPKKMWQKESHHRHVISHNSPILSSTTMRRSPKNFDQAPSRKIYYPYINSSRQHYDGPHFSHSRPCLKDDHHSESSKLPPLYNFDPHRSHTKMTYNLPPPPMPVVIQQMPILPMSIRTIPMTTAVPLSTAMPMPTLPMISSTPIDGKDGHLIVHPHQLLGNRYEMLETIGQGTFGKVVKCFDLVARQMVAVKVVRAIPKYSESADYEIDVLTKIQARDPMGSKKCTGLLSYFRDRGHVCIVFPLFGPSLYDFMKKVGYVPFFYDDTWRIARQLLQALRFLHEMKLVHTDLKPENILLLSDETYPSTSLLRSSQIRVIDFGSATFEYQHHSSLITTRHYRAPEVILGNGWSYPADMW
eukprot:CAMPEP_0201489500 /NCGR_PEP_ID=MMETSP0151_2-20130828/22840_1 /ASSEMBLY_ACC=CAM_ASM_000257 /TAXON_ID=200890 /ORGANISM="Paramoeba atlantica, Strain 621/1 / CCAP 1560/9" /LENGTH=548 /DNA_ID=CAMNT_0047875115 /DNA_START=124 /DNA_END=1767 /DNA_ORIENTATION=+